MQLMVYFMLPPVSAPYAVIQYVLHNTLHVCIFYLLGPTLTYINQNLIVYETTFYSFHY